MSQGFDLVTFVAKEDESRIREADASIPTAILSNGVDLKEFEFSVAPRETEVVFAGHLGVYHNVVMATRLIEKIFPLIQKAIPEARLTIVGKDPSKALAELVARTAGATLKANVPDMKPYLRRAGVFVHPQEVGAGIQNKLLEAMAIGTPVVTSAVGASGIEGVVNEKHALVRGSDEEFAAAAIMLLEDEEKRMRISVSARHLIEQRYSWDHVFEKLDRIVNHLIGKKKSDIGA